MGVSCGVVCDLVNCLIFGFGVGGFTVVVLGGFGVWVV